MKKYLKYLIRINTKVLPKEGPLAAILLIPVIIISGAYWTSIPFYLVIAVLWIFQRTRPIPWEAGIILMTIILFAWLIVSKTDYNFLIYSFKIIGCFIVVASLKPAIQSHQRLWIDMFFVLVLATIWETNAFIHLGRWTFDMGYDRYLPNWTAIYCYLFAMLAVRWRLPLALITALVLGWLTGSRNFSLALGVVGVGYLLLPIWKWVFSKTSRTIILYLFFACGTLWILEQITTRQWSGIQFFGDS